MDLKLWGREAQDEVFADDNAGTPYQAAVEKVVGIEE
jgi:hypothetical protein